MTSNRVKLWQRKLPSGNRKLYLHYTSNGKRVRENTPFMLLAEGKGIDPRERTSNKLQNADTLEKVYALRAERELEIFRGRDGMYDPNRRNSSFVEFYQQVKGTRPTAGTQITWAIALRHLQEFMGEQITFSQLTEEKLEAFKNHMLEKVSANSVAVYLTKIKAALKQAVRKQIIPSNPAAFVKVKTEKKNPTFLTLKELHTLNDTPCKDKQARNAFLFSCFTGLRYSDLVALAWTDIKEGNIELRQKKTGEPIRVPLSANAKDILKEQRESVQGDKADKVFPLPTHQAVDLHLKAWGKAAGISKRLSMHKARHTYATLTYKSTNDIYLTSKLLGHANIQATQIYAHVQDEQKKQAMKKQPRFKMQE